MKSHYNLIVIGSGPGGQKAALQAAKAGRSALVIESYSQLGGACIHYGTLPSKSFRESIYRFSLGSQGILGRDRDGKGEGPSVLPDMKRLLRRRNRVVDGEVEIVQGQFKRNKVDHIQGHGRILGKNEVEVQIGKTKEKARADFIVIATGARPAKPTLIDVDGKTVHDSNTILSLKAVPERMAVMGAGVIGVEYASMFLMAGTKVTMIDRNKEILTFLDKEIVSAMLERFKHFKMDVRLDTKVDRIEKKKDALEVYPSGGKKIEVDALLVAQGRQGNIENLGLESVGIQANERGQISVNAHYQTSVPNIYALGDVVGFPALASTSMEQGRIAALHAFGLESKPVMPEHYPYGVYTIPEVSTIGFTEEQLKKDGVPYIVGRAPYEEIARGQIVGDRWGLLKLIVHRDTLKILGVHIVGDNAADLIHIGQAVMELGGDLHYFVRTVFNYPTLAEAYKTAGYHALNKLKKS